MLLFLWCIVGLAMATYKEGVPIEFDMEEGDSKDYRFELDDENLILYVRPPIKGIDKEESKLERKHKSGDRMLSKSLGVIEFSLDGKMSVGDTTILHYYSTQLFVGVSKSSKVTLECKQGPCKGTVTAYSQELNRLESEEYSLRKSSPVMAFYIDIPKKFNRILAEFKILNDAENVVLDIFNGDAELMGNDIEVMMAMSGSNPKQCNDCRVHMVLSGETLTKHSVKVGVQLRILQDETTLQLNHKDVDYLFDDNLYKYVLPKEFNILNIKINGQQLPRVLINMESRPNNIKEYLYDSQIEGSLQQELDILLRRQDVVGDVMYIRVTGVQTAYLMQLQILNEEPVLHANNMFMAFIKPDYDHKYFIKQIPTTDNIELEVAIHHLNNGQTQVLIAPCDDAQCTTQPSADNSANIQVMQSKDAPRIRISPKCNYIDKDGFCTYLLIVKETYQASGYLIGSRIVQGTMNVRTNQPYKNYIVEGELQQFMLHYDKSKGDTALLFTVNTNNVMYLVSFDTKCWPVQESCAKHIGGSENLLILRGDSLKSSIFYVAILARATTIYTFTAEVRNEQSETVKQLVEDETFRGVLNPGIDDQDIAYFRFNVDFDAIPDIEISEEIVNPIIEINLRGAKYKLAIVVNLGDKLPSIDDFQLVSLNNYLAIHPTDSENYLRKGVYSMAIQYMTHKAGEDTDDSTSVPFSVTYSTSRSVKSLQLNQLIHDEIAPSSTKVYSFHTTLLTSNLLLTKHESSQSKVQVSLSAFATRDSNSFVVQLSDTQSTLEITQDAMDKLCVDDQPGDDINQGTVICQVYVFVENHNGDRVAYSLNVWQPNIPLELHDGQQQILNLQDIKQVIKLYYLPISYSYDTLLAITSFYGITKYSLKILDASTGIEQLYYSESNYKTQHSKSIGTSVYDECKPQCQLIIELETQQQQFRPPAQSTNDEVTILISQQFMEIQSGVPVELSAGTLDPRYLIYNDLKYSIADPNSRLKIVLHEVFGRGVLCLTFSDDLFIRMPIYQLRESCDYAVVGNHIELSGIQLKEIVDKYKLESNPVMIIEVSALATDTVPLTGKFILHLDSSHDISHHRLMLGNPLRFKLDIDDRTTLSFYNFQEESLELKLTRFNGPTYLTITRQINQVNETIYDADDVLAGQTLTHFAISNQDKKMFCQHCTYYFMFRSKGFALEALFTVTTRKNYVKLSQGVGFTDYLDGKDDYNLYHYSFDPDHQTEIRVTLFEGDVEMYLSFSAQSDYTKYEMGPFNRVKYGSALNLTDLQYFEGIVPPRDHLVDNMEIYNMTPYSHPNHTLAGHFNEDDVFLYIRGLDKQSNYSIVVTQGQTGVGSLLQDGVLSQSSLSRGTPTAIFYYHHVKGAVPNVIIRIEPIGIVHLLTDQLVKVEAKNESTDSNFTTLALVSMYDHQLTYQLPDITGMITIKVTSLLAIKENQGQINYVFDKNGGVQQQVHQVKFYQFGLNYINRLEMEISINSKDIYLLSLERELLDQVTPNGGKYYEAYIAENGKLGIQIQNCMGDLQIGYSQTYSEYLREEYSAVKQTFEGSVSDFIISVNKGPLYLRIKSDSADQSVFKLNTQRFKSDQQIPYGQLIPGGDGGIKYNFEYSDSDKIAISFKPLKCVACDIRTEASSTVIYRISWASSEVGLNLIGKCGAYQYQTYLANNTGHYGSQSISTFYLNQTAELSTVIDVSQQSDNQEMYVSVVASILTFDGEALDGYQVYYHNAELQLPKNAVYMFKHKRNEFILAVSVLMLFSIAILCCLCHFYRKLRSLKKKQINLELENRMHEAKNNKVEVKVVEQYGELHEENEQE